MIKFENFENFHFLVKYTFKMMLHVVFCCLYNGLFYIMYKCE